MCDCVFVCVCVCVWGAGAGGYACACTRVRVCVGVMLCVFDLFKIILNFVPSCDRYYGEVEWTAIPKVHSTDR